MISKNRILLFIFPLMASTILVSCLNNSVSKTYYDADWKETTKENASYYRLSPKKENGIWHIRDFYISGEKQFIGQTKDSLGTVFHGDVTWYFKTGKVESKIRYNNGKQVDGFVTVEGAIGSDEEGWDEKDLYYYDDHLVTNAANAQGDRATAQAVSVQSPSTETYQYYYTNTSIIASQHTNNVGYDDEFSFTLFFNKEEDIIGRLKYNKESEKWEGKEVIFYETEKDGKDEMNSIKKINTYVNGVIEQTQYYNTDGEQIAEGFFKDEKPFTGTFSLEACWFNKIEYYENGILFREITFNKDNKLLGELSFKNEKGEADTGILYDCNSLQTYKHGKSNGITIQYFSDESKDEQFIFGYKNDILHGDYFIYKNPGVLLEKGRYENGIQKGEVWYYNHDQNIEEGDRLNYYLKTTIQSVNNKPFISELSQFRLDNNELLKTFEFEQNSTDKFTYLDNGNHTIYLKDLNSDGFDDLQIWYSHEMQDIASHTYYLFNSETGKYQHIAELDDVQYLKINTDKKNSNRNYQQAV